MNRGHSVIVSNASIVLHDQVVLGSVSFRDGIIESIAEQVIDLDGVSKQGSQEIDGTGSYLIPGLVEIHTDALEWHLRPRPQSIWPAPAAVVGHDAVLAACGITTVLDSLCIGDLGSDGFRADILSSALSALDEARRRSALRIDHHLHLRCEVADPRTHELFEQEVQRDSVRMVSLMDHTPGIRQYRDVDAYRRSMNARLVPEQGHGAVEAKIALLQERSARYSMANWRAIADIATSLGIALASHDDATVEDIDLAIASGVSISEFPTSLESATAAKANGLVTAAGAPNVVRGGSHSGNVRAADLASAGLLDILTSDYAPYSLLHAPFMLWSQGILTLPAAIALVTSAPAAAVGLHDRGVIQVGKRADLTMVQLSGDVPTVRAVWSAGQRVS